VDQDTARQGTAGQKKTLELDDFTVVFDEKTHRLEGYHGDVQGQPIWTIPEADVSRLYAFLGQLVREPAGIG
jgi:hypothetical protein